MIRTVLFDLDGTLLDTLSDLTDSVNAALTRMGFAVKSLDEVRASVGSGVRNLILRVTPAGTDEATRERCLTLFREHYSRHMDEKTVPYPGVPELLAGLRERGVKTAVISNKYDQAVKRLCGKYFPGAVDLALGERPGVPKKPDPALVRLALAELAADPAQAVYVGDSDLDVETARRAQMPCVAVSWGFRSRESLQAAGPAALIDDPADFLAALEELGK